MRRAALVLAAALLLDAVWTFGIGTLSGALFVAVAAVGIVMTGRTRSRDSVLLACLAVVLGAFLALRAAPWLVTLDAIGAGAALLAAALLANRGRLFDLDASTAVALARRAVPGACGAFAGRAAAVRERADGGRFGDGAAVLRGVAVAVPVAGVLVLLLASADAVFAHLLTLELPGTVGRHAAALGVGAALAGSLAAVADHAPATVLSRRRRPRRRAEALVVLFAADAVLGGFALTQLVTLLGGADAVVTSSGLTYAEYARTGFFQLVAVAVVMLGVVGSIRAVARPTRSLAVLSGVAIALTLAVVAVAARRMLLYQDAYGLTVLRLVVEWTIVWIAIALVLIGVALGRIRDCGRWLTGALGVSSALLLVALNAANPEAIVARVNLDRAHHGAAIDLHYLAGLSADAAPTLAGDPLTRSLDSARPTPPSGILDWNRSRAR